MAPERGNRSKLQPLPDDDCRNILILALISEGARGMDGPETHWLARRLLVDQPEDDAGLHDWLTAALSEAGVDRRRFAVTARNFDAACRRAEELMQRGVHAVRPQPAIPPCDSDSPTACPTVLFAVGWRPEPVEWTAFFNSRKPRKTSPDVRWLRVLRRLVAACDGSGEGIASSVGTPTYDVACAHAVRKGLPLLRVLPVPLDLLFATDRIRPEGLTLPADYELSCLLGSDSCDEKTRMNCRDRLLTWIADRLAVVELRRNSGLLRAITDQIQSQPKRLVLFVPAKENSLSAGNLRLVEHPHATEIQIIREDELAAVPATGGDRRIPEEREGESASLHADSVDWDGYLYHYTRFSPGRWPAQDYREYLESLLDGDPLCGHSGLDTLVRILQDGCIYGSPRMVRGDRPVVSWTARPPLEMLEIRRWNRGLLRWTFEPYGVAVKREFVRQMGAKPVIYARETDFHRIGAGERYRFQVHEPPARRWKQEREFRMIGDFDLSGLVDTDVFIVVSTPGDVRRVREHVDRPLPAFISCSASLPQSQK